MRVAVDTVYPLRGAQGPGGAFYDRVGIIVAASDNYRDEARSDNFFNDGKHPIVQTGAQRAHLLNTIR